MDGHDGDAERYGRVEPPPSQGCVRQQPGQDRCGEAGANQVLGAFAAHRGRAEPGADALLGDAQQRHDDQASGGHGDARPGGGGALCGDESAEGVGGNVGREQEVGDGDRLLRAAFSGVRQGADAGEPPHDDDAGQRLDDRVQTEPEQRDRAREDSGGNRDGAFGGHAGQRQPRQPPGDPGLAEPLRAAVLQGGGDGRRWRAHAGGRAVSQSPE
jgi:hypothetical protein